VDGTPERAAVRVAPAVADEVERRAVAAAALAAQDEAQQRVVPAALVVPGEVERHAVARVALAVLGEAAGSVLPDLAWVRGRAYEFPERTGYRRGPAGLEVAPRSLSQAEPVGVLAAPLPVWGGAPLEALDAVLLESDAPQLASQRPEAALPGSLS
jgi:hypothetical protein